MSNSDELRRRAEAIFHDALAWKGPDRVAFLDRACAGDAQLRHEVESLLEAAESLDGFLDEPVVQAPEVPEAIGPYRLLRPLGRGGMGEVWLAAQSKPIRREVAIKVIRPGMDSKEIVHRFQAERQALALMEHPSVARVFDAGATDRGQPYFVMEYVDGRPINEYCREQRLSINARLELVESVCDAIQHAHQKTILHRDIKPTNVLVTERDGRPEVKVIDFGVAKAMGDSLGDETMFTRHGSVLGTPEYMSPEQSGAIDHAVDTRSDVYSIGVLLYELLVGALPIEGEQIRGAMSTGTLGTLYRDEHPRLVARLRMLGDRAETAATERATNPRELEQRLHGELEWITGTALALEPQRRYQTPADLAADLRRHRSGESVLAAPPSRRYRMRKFVRRNRGAVATAAVIVVGLLLGGAGLGAGLMRALEAEESAREQARTAEEVTDFLVDLFEVSDPSRAQGEEISARAVLDQGATEIGQRLDEDPLIRGTLLASMSQAYWGLGVYDEAESLAVRAVSDLGSVLETADPRLLAARQKVALARFYGGDYAGALELIDATLAVQSQAHGPDHRTALPLRNVRAQLLSKLGRLDEALTEQQWLIERLDSEGPEMQELLVTTWNNHGTAYAQVGRFEEARKAYGRTLAVMDSIGVEDDARRARLRINLSATSAQMGELDTATEQLEEILPELDRLFGPNHMETIGARANHAAFLFMAEDLPAAITAFEVVIPRAETALGPRHPQVARVVYNYGLALMNAERPAEAATQFERTHEIRREALGPDHTATVAALFSLATAQGRAGQVQAARDSYEEVIDRRAAALGEDHVEVAKDLDAYAGFLEDAGLAGDAARARERAEAIRAVDAEE